MDDDSNAEVPGAKLVVGYADGHYSAGNVMDKSGYPVGLVEDGGKVKDMKGNRLGQWDSDGDLFNSSGSRVTKLSRSASNAVTAVMLLGGH
jgi:hypothetical protein